MTKVLLNSRSLGLSTMFSFTSEISIIMLLLLSAARFNRRMCSGHRVVRCNEMDRRALLVFKQNVSDPQKELSSWSSEVDCCAWTGVQCDNHGRVTILDLHQKYLEGEINLSLLELEFLNHLDLSYNSFDVINIPSIYDYAANSKMSDNQSLVTHPHPLANFSNLHYLDLSTYENYLHMDNLHWLSRVSSLKYLNLTGIDLHNETNWLQSVTILPSLLELRLSNCQLTNISPSLKHGNFTSLVTLDLSGNHFDSELPNWLFNLGSDISYLDLSSNLLRGQIPKDLLNLSSLKSLLLDHNKLGGCGSIPDWLGQLEHLQVVTLNVNLFGGSIPSNIGNISSLINLEISSNYLSGSLPERLGQLTNLETLGLANNSLAGVLSEVNFAKLSNLKVLNLGSGFAFDLDPTWDPPFQLFHINLGSSVLGPNFPAWLYTQRSLEYLDISGSGISSIDEDMFWSFAAGIDTLDLSNNSISGDLSNVLLNSSSIFLDFNNFKGGLPHLSWSVNDLGLAHNSFTGSLSPLLCHTLTEYNYLFYLDISDNLLTGELPDCWMNWKQLSWINLGSNSFTGEVPLSIGSLSLLHSLDLHNNSLFGDITSSLQNSTSLTLLNLERNKFSGSIPNVMQRSLHVIKLRSNLYSGFIPPQLCQLSSLIILDLSDNKISGPIPQCLYNIAAMVLDRSNDDYLNDFVKESGNIEFVYTIMVSTKGQQLEYLHNLGLVRTVDLSANNLSGEIPRELFSLIQLQSLNLSRNHLTGKIPGKIGDMKHLESLDLSHNQLYGEIPETISALSFLSYMNLSYNNFNGQIPLGTQLQSFDAWSYVGNPELCGAPLTKHCTKEENYEKPKMTGGNEVDSITESLYLGMGVGFAVGFWGVCGALFLNRAWRHSYFRFLDGVGDKLYVAVILKFNHFRQMVASFISDFQRIMD